MSYGPPVIIAPGEKYGRLTVLSVGPRTIECRCDCGAAKAVSKYKLKTGHTRSCGCLLLEHSGGPVKHGMWRTRTWESWSQMRKRCLNPKNAGYAAYGGRGIKICDSWNDFNNFLTDMGECPPGLTIDRRDNNGNYEPGNCRWATMAIQTRNRRSNVVLNVDGRRMVLADAAIEFGLHAETISRRLKRGMSVMAALTTPSKQERRA